jgi:DNA polymerase
MPDLFDPPLVHTASPATDEARCARLAHPTDLDGFRREARRLLAAGVPPDAVVWQVAGEAGDLWSGMDEAAGMAAADHDAATPFDPADPAIAWPDGAAQGWPDGVRPESSAEPADGLDAELPASASPGAVETAAQASPEAPSPTDRLTVPRAFLQLCQRVVLHRDPVRWPLLYRLLWRLQHERALRHDAADADWLQARQMAREVQRDMHKMKAFVRFRELPGGAAEGQPLFIAWFEPVHRIVQAVGPFFARRFANMRWAIFTPDLSLHWDGQTLHTGPAARKSDLPADDAVEDLWLTYYAHIFNPARLNLRTMAREMPRRYWANLPEARLIAPLAAQAGQRTQDMVGQAPTEPRRGSRRVAVPGRAVGLHDHETSTAHLAPDVVSIDALRERAARCRDCPLWEPATQTVFGEGAAQARLMLVGEQPGDQEDVRGRPFVGPAGKLLDRALDEVGLDRDALYVTNAVKHFKYELRGTRRIHKTPTQREAAACLHWLESEIDAVAPQALVALGATAARSLLGRAVSVMAERGQWLRRHDGRPVLVTLHPSALLRLPHEERDAAYARWVADLQLALQPVPQAS